MKISMTIGGSGSQHNKQNESLVTPNSESWLHMPEL